VVARLTTALRADPALAHVSSITSVLDQAAGRHSATALAAVESRPGARSLLGDVVNADRGGDATLVPAAMRLMGRANWWVPRWLDRLLPRAEPTASAHRVSRREATIGGGATGQFGRQSSLPDSGPQHR
jgi:hypothetical protein